MGYYWNNFLDRYKDAKNKDLILVLEAFFYYCKEQVNKSDELMNYKG
jgi:hypothetical protein